MSGKLLIVVALSIALLPTVVLGQTYESTTHLMISGGTSTPVRGLNEFWSTGPHGRLTIRFPMGGTLWGGLQGGVVGLGTDESNSELVQFPLRVLAYFPLAPEASGTPYIAFGVGATVNKFSCRDKIKTCYLDEAKNNVAYTVAVGYTMRPEAMAHAFFDFGIRYDQQIVNNKNDYIDIGVEVGIGLCL